MAVVVPLIAMYAGVSAGMAIAAGAAVTFGSALAIAGGMAAGLGLVTGDKDFQKLGGILSAGAGLAGALEGAGAAAGAGAGEASSAWDAAGAAEGSDMAQLGKYGYQGDPSAAVSPGIEQATGAVDAVGNAGTLADAASTYGSNVGAGNVFDPWGVQTPAGGTLSGYDAAGQAAAGLNAPAQPPSLTGSLTDAVQTPVASQAYQTPVQELSPLSAPQPARPGWLEPTAAPTLTPLQQAAQTTTQGDIASYAKQVMAKGGEALSGAGKWMQQNPMLTMAAGQMLQGMYGPQAEQMDMQKSIYERARRNLNSPVRMQYLRPTTTPGG